MDRWARNGSEVAPVRPYFSNGRADRSLARIPSPVRRPVPRLVGASMLASRLFSGSRLERSHCTEARRKPVALLPPIPGNGLHEHVSLRQPVQRLPICSSLAHGRLAGSKLSLELLRRQPVMVDG